MNLWTAKVSLHVLNAHNFMIDIFPDMNLPMKIMDCTILAEANTTINAEFIFLIFPEIRMKSATSEEFRIQKRTKPVRFHSLH